MPPSTPEVNTTLFMVRVWLEEVDDGRKEWRGKIQRVISGETLYFRDWDSMLAFLRGDNTADAAVVSDQQAAKGEQSQQDKHDKQPGKHRR